MARNWLGIGLLMLRQVDGELVGETEEQRGEQRPDRVPPTEDQRGQRDEARARRSCSC